uniref:Uncharacterized protein n=1 Tax=Timspurckia oligopyrenoides TaxID=708627 RepID=A0A7S0ZLD8_9RHOD|mmetsp:Transcript_9709/g.17499  ORF Transcript_9709/g.17499 Transcript_9709/m.17499 type:complete len:130 (+) Transcript_9709:74-463(+)
MRWKSFGILAILLPLVCLCTRVFLVESSRSDLSCGTLDLNHPFTQHCFPSDGSHHFVCCVDIQFPHNSNSPHGNYNPLGDVIMAASQKESYSWCTCSEEICEQQLHGRVQFNMNGIGWRGYLPPSLNDD